MDISILHLSPASLLAIQSLSLKVDSIVRENINPQKSIAELVTLLKTSQNTPNVTISKSLQNLLDTLSPPQASFLSKLGAACVFDGRYSEAEPTSSHCQEEKNHVPRAN